MMRTTQLKTKQLVSTGLEITRVGCGAWAIGGEWEVIGVIVYSPMGSGLLAGRMTRERIVAMPEDEWHKQDPRFQQPELSRNLDIVDRLTPVAQRHDTVPGAVAVAWTLHGPAVEGAIGGF